MKIILFLFFLTLSFYANENLFKALPLNEPVYTQKVKLGQKLFHDTLLSKDNTISCATCHPVLNYGVDNLSKSIGIKGQKGDRNTPTVWNAVYNFSQFWDGRAKDLKEQALDPIINPKEMGETLASVVEKLKKDEYYVREFDEIYEDGISANNLADAIAEYEKTLTTPKSKFDSYLRGDISALSAKEKEGLKLFIDKGCIACHNGQNIGGNLYQKSGVYEEIQTEGSPDLGRYNITKKIFDKYYFKVPSLRNVEMTAPYFHDGSAVTLKDAVAIMVKSQLGRQLKDEEIDDIVLFLKTLTGRVHE